MKMIFATMAMLTIFLAGCGSSQKIRLTEAQLTLQRDSVGCSAALNGGGFEVDFPLPALLCGFLPMGQTILMLQRPDTPTPGIPPGSVTH